MDGIRLLTKAGLDAPRPCPWFCHSQCIVVSFVFCICMISFYFVFVFPFVYYDFFVFLVLVWICPRPSPGAVMVSALFYGNFLHSPAGGCLSARAQYPSSGQHNTFVHPSSQIMLFLLFLLLFLLFFFPLLFLCISTTKRAIEYPTTKFLKAFQLPAWVTRPECPKVAKDEAKKPKGPPISAFII